MLRIGVLISGGGTNLQAIIDNSLSKNIDGKVEIVISNKENAYGLTRARENNIDAIYLNPKEFVDERAYDLEIIRLLNEKSVDLVVLAGYLKILTGEFINKFKGRVINIHPSLIPKYCGPGYYGEKVHRAVLDGGEAYSGATVHFVDEGVDTGDIILQKKVEVYEGDSIDSLSKRVLKIEHDILVEAIKKISRDNVGG